MTLSDKAPANIDWKLNQLLSASRASRSYVTRQVLQVPVTSPGFAPWSPREIGPVSMDNPPVADDQFASDSMASRATETSAAADSSALAHEHKPRAGLSPGAVVMMPDELEQFRSTAFEQGKQQVYAEQKQIADANEQRFTELMQALSAARVDYSSFHAAVAELSLFIATQVVRAEITTQSAWYESLIDRCLDEIRRHGSDRITVRVSRLDFDRHHQRFERRQDLVMFVADDSLQQGDVELEMGATKISEVIAAKLAHIAEDMAARLASITAGHEDGSRAALTPEVD